VPLEFGEVGNDGFHLEMLAVNAGQVRFVFKEIRVLKINLERGFFVSGELHQGFIGISRQVTGVSGWANGRGDHCATVEDVKAICGYPSRVLEGDAATDPAGAEAKVHSSFARGFECGPGAFGNPVFANQRAVDVNQDEFDHS
jgi:hypothetical protein